MKRNIKPFLLCIILYITFPGYIWGETVNTNSMYIHKLNQLKSSIPPLDLNSKPNYSRLVMEYFKYYNLDISGLDHYFGYFTSGEYQLSAHIFVPEYRTGTVILMHGYFDHTGTLEKLIRHCLKKSLAVAIYDLPGHGLSSGDRLSITGFSEYTAIFHDFVGLVHNRFPDLFCLIAHSTGCAVVYEYIYNHLDYQRMFEKIIFLAPLVRHAYWNISTTNVHLAKPFVDKLPRKIRENSSDGSYIKKVMEDPLQDRYFPIKWLEALYAWDQKIQKYDKKPIKIMIIQGKNDTVVDWEYNIPFLSKRLDLEIIKTIDAAKHQLANESPSIRKEVFDMISSYLE